MRARKKPKKAPIQGARRKDWAWLAWAEWGLAILLAGVALFYHFTFFTHVGSLWRDEVHCVEMASLPSVSSIFQYLRYDSFPVLYTLALRIWIHTGLSNDQGLRAFGFLAGVILLGALWLACRFLRCPRPLISLALVGLNPWVIRTTDSIRPYGLGIVWLVLTLGFVWKAVETSRREWFLLAGLSAVLSVQCMYQSAFLLLAICFGGVVVCLRDLRVKAAMGVVLVGLAAAATLVLSLPNISAAQSWGILVRSPVPMKRLFEVLFQALGAGSSVALWSWFGFAVLSGAVGVHALLSRRRQHAARARSNLALYCTTVLVTAAVAYLAAMKAAQLMTQPWYFVPLAVLVAPAVDASVWLAGATNRWRVLRIAVVPVIACAVAIPGWRQVHGRWTNVDVVAARVGQQATAEDTIVLDPFWIGITFQRYYKGPAKWVTLPPLEDVHICRFDLVKAAMARPNPLGPVLETMSKTLQSGHRVFYLQSLAVTLNGAPPVLPPAPHPKTGWYFGPYLFGWARQAMYSLQSHGMRSEPLDAPTDGPTIGYEDVAVTIVSGWRE